MEQDGRASASGEGAEAPDERVGWDQRVDTRPPLAGESLGATIAALADPATRSPRPDTCPFLRTIDASGAAAAPIEVPDGSNRCVAVGEPAPQSARQQQLACLASGHSNCPRYLRGALVAADALAPVSVSRGPSMPVIASALALVLAAAISVGFLLVRGGFDLPASAAGGSPIAAASVPPSKQPTASAVATVPPSGPGPTEPSTAATPSPPPPTEPPPTTTATPAAPAVSPAPTPAPTSNRYALLDPCPVAPDCWVYTVRPGDNLLSIANYFGVPYGTVIEMNPQLDDPTNIHTGDEIRMPPPTR